MLIKLPSSVVNIAQLKDLAKHLDSSKLDSSIVESFFIANPKISKEPHAIKMVVEYLLELIDRPAEMEVVFAQATQPDFEAELIEWMRDNVHPCVMLDIKRDQLLTGGFVLCTPQRIYDFSWVRTLESQRDYLNRLVTHAN